MFDKFPCFRIKRRNPNGQTSEIEIRPSLLRWLLIFVLVLAFLIRGGDPTQLFRNLLHLPSIPSNPLFVGPSTMRSSTLGRSASTG